MFTRSFLTATLVAHTVFAYRGIFLVETRDDTGALVSDTLRDKLNDVSLACTVTSRQVFDTELFFGESFAVECDDTLNVANPLTSGMVTQQLSALEKVQNTWDVEGRTIAGAPSNSGDGQNELRRRRSEPQDRRQSSLRIAARDLFGEAGTTKVAPRAAKAGNSSTSITHTLTGVDRLHAEGLLGKGIRVAMIDEGFDHKGVDALSKTNIEYAVDAPTGGPDPFPKDCKMSHGTYTLGIIGANSEAKKFGLVGVAPEATFSLYNVGVCNQGGISLDEVMKTFTTVAAKKYDIITTSQGGSSSYAFGPFPDILKKVQEAGTFVSFPNGNAPGGPFGSVFGGGVAGVTSSGNYNPEQVSSLTWGASAVDSKGAKSAVRFVPGFPYSPPADNKLTVWWPDESKVTSLDNCLADLCDPLPAGTKLPKDPANTILLTTMGCCWSAPGDKTNTTQITTALKIPYIIYRQPDPMPYVDWVEGREIMAEKDVSALKGIVSVSAEEGVALIKATKAGTVQVTLPATAADGDMRVDTVADREHGGALNLETSWGPAMTGGELQPRVVSPGNGELSAVPSYLGGLGVGSGTSGSSPFTAGVVALMKLANPKLKPAELSHRLSHTAKPVKFIDSEGARHDFLSPVISQGGGLIDAYAAVHEPTLLSVGSLNFNDTANRPKSLSFDVINNGKTALTYTITHEPASSGYITRKENPELLTNATAYAVYAEVDISPKTLKVEAGAKATVTVSITKDPALSEAAARGSYFGGYVALVTSASTVRMAYTGFGAPMTAIKGPYFVSEYTSSLATDGTNVLPIKADHVFECKRNDTADPPVSCKDGMLPSLQWGWSLPSPKWSIDVVDASDKVLVKDLVTGDQTVQWDSDMAMRWPPVNDQKNLVNNGKYSFRISALTMNGHPDKSDDYAVFKSLPFVIKRVS